jgi:hypothetical protein
MSLAAVGGGRGSARVAGRPDADRSSPNRSTPAGSEGACLGGVIAEQQVRCGDGRWERHQQGRSLDTIQNSAAAGGRLQLAAPLAACAAWACHQAVCRSGSSVVVVVASFAASVVVGRCAVLKRDRPPVGLICRLVVGWSRPPSCCCKSSTTAVLETAWRHFVVVVVPHGCWFLCCLRCCCGSSSQAELGGFHERGC